MIPAAVVFAYLALVLYIGIFAFHARSGAASAEEYFLAGRSLGPTVFLLSLVGTNMTAFSILGASGHAFANGIVTYGLMASSSALVIPVALLLIGTRLWALGKRYGFMTPVQLFRDRWECGHIGTAIFAVQAVLLVPYIIIAVMGGGTTLQAMMSLMSSICTPFRGRRLRISAAYSSGWRWRSVNSRQVAHSFSPWKAPRVMLVFPMSRASSMVASRDHYRRIDGTGSKDAAASREASPAHPRPDRRHTTRGNKRRCHFNEDARVLAGPTRFIVRNSRHEPEQLAVHLELT